jgi:hypothetical protein
MQGSLQPHHCSDLGTCVFGKSHSKDHLGCLGNQRCPGKGGKVRAEKRQMITTRNLQTRASNGISPSTDVITPGKSQLPGLPLLIPTLTVPISHSPCECQVPS